MREAQTTALVTGGARRIGRAVVEDLASNGFAVAIHCNRSASAAHALAERIAGEGGRVAVLEADLTDADAAENLVVETERAIGPVGLLVNNASIFRQDRLTDEGWPDWDAHFHLHVKAPAILARAMHRRLPEGREGLIVNMIDQRVWRPTPLHFSYTLSKSALWTATRTMAQALAPRIRVNAIGPGPTLPNERQSDEEFGDQVDAVLLRRAPGLSEFGAAIRWLWQARSVTGQMVALDGGQHLAWETPDMADGTE
jgi:NAD(P)-dependent dehydrogenase (short-subunit alcohol dehydrogenase family)